MNTPLIEMNVVCFAYPAIDMMFDLEVAAQTITIITGPSGSGKSTLLNLIAGFEAPTSGGIKLLGQDVTNQPPSKRPLAMLFQDNNVFEHLTVEANVSLGIKPNLKLNAAERATVSQALERVGLGDKLHRLPAELSGGERQRIAFARMLVQSRPILLLDEPFASLGPALRQEMTVLLAQLQQEKQLTILAVTHHPREWMGVAQQFVFVQNGSIIAHGPMQDLLETTENTAIADYLGTKV
jgi:thiamine transport system ATP-binding protein